MSSPWYEEISGRELQQGDLLLRCPVPLIPPNWTPDSQRLSPNVQQAIGIEIEFFDVIILSQSCDLVNRKLRSVLVCPFWPLEKLPELVGDEKLCIEVKRLRSLKNTIRQGLSPRFHMIEACTLSGHEQSISLIDFWTVYTIPFASLEMLAEEQNARLRLLSPYVEHLSQAFARFIMRVGLPAPIAEFK
jgi:hypothetical protein